MHLERSTCVCVCVQCAHRPMGLHGFITRQRAGKSFATNALFSHMRSRRLKRPISLTARRTGWPASGGDSSEAGAPRAWISQSGLVQGIEVQRGDVVGRQRTVLGLWCCGDCESLWPLRRRPLNE